MNCQVAKPSCQQREIDSIILHATDDRAEMSVSTMMATRHVLLVDDNRNWTDATAEYLRDEGFTVETAYDGLTAIQKLRSFHPHVIVADIHMPGIDGFEMLRLIRHAEMDFPVIMVTAKVEDIKESDAVGAGATMLLAKPIDVDGLVRAIEHVADHGEHRFE